MIILHRFLCYPCPIHPCNGSFLCFEHVITIGGPFRSFFGGVPLLDPCLVPLLCDGLFLLMKPFLARLICHTSFTCRCYILACAVLPLFCAWLLPSRCPFPSDVPGQHRRAFITKMQVLVPIVSINAFCWCLDQDSMTDFYVLPLFNSADRHHSSTAIIVVHHFAF
jgi:hypothetical protein